MAIGAAKYDPPGTHAQTNNGHVRVWKRDGNTWNQIGEIIGESYGDRSGASVSLSSDGSIVAIGAVYNDGNGEDSGHVRVYQWSDGAWTQQGDEIDGEAVYEESGPSVSLSADGSIAANVATYGIG